MLNDGFLDMAVVEGGFDSESFLNALHQVVLPHMNAFPGPRSILFMDNCIIHRQYEVIHSPTHPPTHPPTRPLGLSLGQRTAERAPATVAAFRAFVVSANGSQGTTVSVPSISCPMSQAKGCL